MRTRGNGKRDGICEREATMQIARGFSIYTGWRYEIGQSQGVIRSYALYCETCQWGDFAERIQTLDIQEEVVIEIITHALAVSRSYFR